MKKHNVLRAQSNFSVLQTSNQSQAAVMTLPPGSWSDEKGNAHPDSEQVLLVLEGEVIAEIGKDREQLQRGDVVIVPKGVEHRFGNESKAIAVTFNVYSPPAY